MSDPGLNAQPASISPLSPLPHQGGSCPEEPTWRTKMLRLPVCCLLPKVTPRSPKSLGAQRGFDPGQGASNPAFLAADKARGLAAGPGPQGRAGSRSVSPEEPDGWKETGEEQVPGGGQRRPGPSEFPVLGWAPALSASEGVTDAGQSPRLWGMFVWRESGKRGFRGGCQRARIGWRTSNFGGIRGLGRGLGGASGPALAPSGF